MILYMYDSFHDTNDDILFVSIPPWFFFTWYFQQSLALSSRLRSIQKFILIYRVLRDYVGLSASYSSFDTHSYAVWCSGIYSFCKLDPFYANNLIYLHYFVLSSQFTKRIYSHISSNIFMQFPSITDYYYYSTSSKIIQPQAK